MNTTADINITIAQLEDIDGGASSSMLIPIAGTDQSVMVEWRMSQYQIGVVDADGDHVEAPGFKVPWGPEARIAWGQTMMAGALSDHITLIPAAISWIGYRGGYQTQAAPGAVAAAAQIAEQIAAVVSAPDGHRALCAISDAEQEITDWRAQHEAGERLATAAIDAAHAWTGALAADMDPADIRVRATVSVTYKRSGRDQSQLTMDRVLSGAGGWLSDETVKLEAQLKPGGRWHTIVDRTVGYAYA